MKETKNPTKVEELTAIFALYTREEVEAAISEYERIKGVKIR